MTGPPSGAKAAPAGWTLPTTERPDAALPRQLLPDNHDVSHGRLRIGGCDLLELAEAYGTPLFVYDEQQLRSRCREAVRVFGSGVA